MSKKIWVFFAVAVLIGCATQDYVHEGDESETPFVQSSEKNMKIKHDERRWISGPLDNKFIIIGVSGRLQRAEDEIETAKLDAARKAALYHGIQGSIEMANTTGSAGFFDYSADSKIDLDYDTDFEKYKESLVFDAERDVFRGTGATYVRFTYNTSDSGLNYSPASAVGVPSWVNNRNLPQFEGYETAVGFAGKRSRLRDTVNASCDSVIARLIESVSFQVTTKDSTVAGGSSTVTTSIKSEGRLENFQVLEFYIEPNNGAVHTLAIARVLK